MKQSTRNLLTYMREWFLLHWLALIIALVVGVAAGRATAATPPTVTLTASVGVGNVPTLTWSAPWATGCTANGGWTGTKAASGSQALPAISASTSYGIACTAPGDTSALATCTAPMQNTDGSALTNLAGFRFYEGTSASSLSNMKQVAGSTCENQYTGLSVGTHYFGVTAYTTQGVESALSNVLPKTITGPQSASASVKIDVPKAPTLTVQDPTAYDVKRKGLKFVARNEVGTVPIGTACSQDFALPGDLYRVARGDVAFTRKTNSAVIVAKCG